VKVQSPQTQRRPRCDDVTDDVTTDERPRHSDDKQLTAATRPKSSYSSSSSSSSSDAVSASSPEDLFDESAAADENDCERASQTTTAVLDGLHKAATDARDKSSIDRQRAETNDTGQTEHTSLRPSQSNCRPLTTTDHCATSRHDAAARANCSAARVTTFQITPTLRQRAFPRTNPAYIGTYRRDRPPAYRRIDSQQLTSVGIASELQTSASPAPVNHATRRPNSDGGGGVQHALTLQQHAGDVVCLSNACARRRGGNWSSTSHQCSATHHRVTDWPRGDSWSDVQVVRPQSDGGSTHTPAVHVTDSRALSVDTEGQTTGDVMTTARTGVIRRQSEPDYVNVITRHQQQHQQQHMSAAVAGRYCSDDSEWTSRQLVPSAIYMNQHELTIAGRYTSRSTCNFMDPITANGNALWLIVILVD